MDILIGLAIIPFALYGAFLVSLGAIALVGVFIAMITAPFKK